MADRKTSRKSSTTVHRPRPKPNARTSNTYHLATTQDGRRHFSQSQVVTQESTCSHHDGSDDSEPAAPTLATPATATDQQRPAKRKTRHKNRVERTLDWLPLRDVYLDEILWHHGPADDSQQLRCVRCAIENGAPLYRCGECLGGRLLCRTCMVESHTLLPLHRIEIWMGTYFRRSSLRELGAVVYLGHSGSPCPKANTAVRRNGFIVCDINYLHRVDVVFCHCQDRAGTFVPHYVQLLRMGWYSTSRSCIKSAFKFSLLDFFVNLNHQAKVNTYDYYKTLERETDICQLTAVPTLYKQMFLAVREWRHLKLLQRGGRGHDPSGIEATQEGTLAIDCPACPQPGRNLPDGWKDEPPERRWLYTLYLMVDANFKLRLKDRGADDVYLGPGWAYVVEEEKYKEHIKKFANIKEKNYCSSEHKAILHANKPRNGYLASGVGAVMCARHAFVCGSGVGDLQRGEKYCNMDYLILSARPIKEILDAFLSYDISCQHYKYFIQRMLGYDPRLHLDLSKVSIRHGIPKKHFAAHGPKHSVWSLNFLRWVGRTYGEWIEPAWSCMNQLAASTKEMAPATRHEAMDCQWSGWNFQKLVGLGDRLLHCLREAFKMHAEQLKIFEEYSATFPSEIVAKWQKEYDAWCAAPHPDNCPFEVTSKHTTMKDIAFALSREDAADIARSIRQSPNCMSPSSFIKVGIELEEQQRVIRQRARGKHNITGKTGIQQKRNALARRIQAWQQTQDMYMPFVGDLRTAVVMDDTVQDGRRSRKAQGASTFIEDVPLLLPSSLPSLHRDDPIIVLFSNKEQRLRVAQADDALADIRHLRCVITRIAQFRRFNVHGTGGERSSRMRSLHDKFQAKVNLAAERYRAAYRALTVLDPTGSWRTQFHPLLDEDICGPGNDDKPLFDPRGRMVIRNGREKVSWIWRVPGVPDRGDLQADDLTKGMQAEWSKARARVDRWSEDQDLLQEEMRRTLVFFEHKATWWSDQRSRRTDAGLVLSRSLGAYADKQADIYRHLARKFAGLWLPFLTSQSVVPSWAGEYPPPATVELSGSDSDDSTSTSVSSSGE